MSDAAATGLLDRAIRRITTVWRDMASSVAGEPTRRSKRRCAPAWPGAAARSARATGRPSWRRPTWRWTRPAERISCARWPASIPIRTPSPRAYAAVQAAADPAERATAKAALRRALEPPRLRLLTQFTSIPDGRKFLVDLRAVPAEDRASDDKLLAALEADLRGLLAAWFDIGFLELRRIDWNSPAALLEKLVDYEAVHAIRSWRDLKNRLDSDRRCYAFFHPRMPGEPLIFVEVALVKGLAGSVQACWTRRRRCRTRARPTPRSSTRSATASGAGRHQLRQFPDQARGRGAVGGVPQSEDVRHAVADAGVPRAGWTTLLAADDAGPAVG